MLSTTVPIALLHLALLANAVPAPADAVPGSTSTPGPPTTVLVTTSGESTWSETFIGTTLTEYATLTAPITLTTTDSSGAVALIAVFAGGLAWAGIPAAVPPIQPPTVPPPEKPVDPPEPTEPPPTPTSTPITTSSSSTIRETQIPIIQSAPTGLAEYVAAQAALVAIQDDQHLCNEKGGPTVNRDQAMDKIGSYCSDKKDKTVDKSDDNLVTYDMGAGIVFNVSVTLDTFCKAGDLTIDEGDCQYFFKQVVDDCDTKSSDKHGGAINDACILWSAVPLEHQGDLVCTGSVTPNTGVDRDEAIRNINDFCKRNSGSSISPNQGNTLEYVQPTGNNQAVISVSFGDCPRQDAPMYKIDETACNRFLTQTIDWCNTDTVTAKYGGKVTDHCGVFNFETQYTDRIACGNNYYKPPKTMDRAEAIDAINEYCDQDYTLDPDYKETNEFQQFTPLGKSYHNRVIPGKNIVVRMKAGFVDPQTGCQPKQKFSTKGPECVRKLTSLIDSCDTATTTEKNGGYLVDRSIHGCVGWEIFAQGTVDE